MMSVSCVLPSGLICNRSIGTVVILLAGSFSWSRYAPSVGGLATRALVVTYEV